MIKINKNRKQTVYIAPALQGYCNILKDCPNNTLSDIQTQNFIEYLKMLSHFILKNGQLGFNLTELRKLFGNNHKQAVEILEQTGDICIEKHKNIQIQYETKESKINRELDLTLKKEMKICDVYETKIFPVKCNRIHTKVRLTKLNAKIFNIIKESRHKDSIWQYHKNAVRSMIDKAAYFAEKHIKSLIKRTTQVVVESVDIATNVLPIIRKTFENKINEIKFNYRDPASIHNVPFTHYNIPSILRVPIYFSNSPKPSPKPPPKPPESKEIPHLPLDPSIPWDPLS